MRALINPWTSIWFTPQNTALWARDNRPLYGVVVLLVLHVLISVAGSLVESPAASAQSAPDIEQQSVQQQLGYYLDVWVMPVVMLFVLYWIGKRFSSTASLTNVVWVMVWSQLPVMLLTLISIPMELSGMRITAPLFSNKLITDNGLIAFDPPILQLNADAVVYFVISTVLLLWSFQILLSGLAAVSGVTVKRALWFLTLAMIALMLIRLPVTLILGDRDLLDILGLKGILEV